MRKNPKCLFSLVGALCAALLSSCNIYDLIGGISSRESSVISHSANAYYTASDLTKRTTYRALTQMDYGDSVPSTGDVKLLVLPIKISGYSWPSGFMSDLDVALNGTAEATGYWESVSSYYHKASGGKLNLSYEIATSYDCGLTPSQIMTQFNGKGAQATLSLIDDAVTAYKNINGASSTQRFDSDSDGRIDGVVAVYSCPDYLNSSIETIDPEGDIFWAFTFWDDAKGDRPSIASPVQCSYFWLSYDFIYQACQSPQVDAHTLIHETGHMLGLDDYYGPSEGKYADFHAAGGYTMMSHNVLDLDPFSKIALGWIDPIVVQDSCELTLRPFESTNETILIAPAPNGVTTFNGSAFDEYILLELYTPEGLNYLDSHVTYTRREAHFTIPGVRVWHVDARLLRRAKGQNVVSYSDDNPLNTSAYEYFVGASNCYKNESYPSYDFSLLRHVSAKPTQLFTDDTKADESSLFTSGTTFNMSTYYRAFPKGTKFNNGKALNFSVKFTSVSMQNASVRITRS